VATPGTTAGADQKTSAPPLTFAQRLGLFFVSGLGGLAVRLIGPTLRWQVSIEEGGPPSERFRGVCVFWHRCIIPAMYWYRRRAIAVMTSSSFDGECIARIIERFGFLAVRGSSSRGGVRALLAMRKVLEQGHTVAFTIDGPRGPRYVAKPGPVLLARHAGVPIYCFHIAVEKAWVLKSWDGFMIPKPFSRALLKIGSLIHVPGGISSGQMQEYHAQMQATLDRVRLAAEAQMTAESGRCA